MNFTFHGETNKLSIKFELRLDYKYPHRFSKKERRSRTIYFVGGALNDDNFATNQIKVFNEQHHFPKGYATK